MALHTMQFDDGFQTQMANTSRTKIVLLPVDNIELLKSWCKKRFEGMEQQLDEYFAKVLAALAVSWMSVRPGVLHTHCGFVNGIASCVAICTWSKGLSILFRNGPLCQAVLPLDTAIQDAPVAQTPRCHVFGQLSSSL